MNRDSSSTRAACGSGAVPHRLRPPLAAAVGLLLLAVPAAGEPLTFAEAVRRAASDAAGSRTAAVKAEEARAKIGQARSALLPGLAGSASESERTFNIETFGISIPTLPGQPPTPKRVGPIEAFDARFRVTQTVFDLASWRKLSAARAGAAQSGAESGAAADRAAHAAGIAYVRALRARAVVEARDQDLSIATQLDTLARLQVLAGAAANIDVIRARTQTAVAKSQLGLARNHLDVALIDLSRALGAPPDARFELADTLRDEIQSEAPEAREAAVPLALSRRDDLRAARARLRKDRADQSAIGAERLPRLDAAADYGASGVHADDAIATRDLALQVSWPVFDGLRREGRRGEQAGVIRESEIRVRDLEQQVAADVSAALLDLASGLEQQGIAGERLSLAERELAEARERFVNGVAGNIEVINAQSSLEHARDAVIDARAATAIARINLARAVGVATSLR